MSLNIKINNFEGPFDLLLHLIKKDKMDIYDIKIYDITNQYLDYIKNMEEMDMEVTSEFIVIAATLIEIKSKMLLPKVKKEDDETSADEQDPRKELINKLIEYKKFKSAAFYLKERMEDTGITFFKKPEIIEEKSSNNINDLLKNVNMLTLYNIYNELINEYMNKMNPSNIIERNITVDMYKIEDKMSHIENSLNIGDKISFGNLIRTIDDKLEIIVTFMAMLELIRLRSIKVLQEENFKEIYLERICINEEE